MSRPSATHIRFLGLPILIAGLVATVVAPGKSFAGDPTLTEASIESVISPHMNQVRYCHMKKVIGGLSPEERQAIQDKLGSGESVPALSGVVLVEFEVGADGLVSSAAVRSATFDDADVHQCIESRFYRMSFPAGAIRPSQLIAIPLAPEAHVSEVSLFPRTEPLPREKWPDWMKQAGAAGFVVMDEGEVPWLFGTWKDGVWKEGTFGGTFQGGTFAGGTFAGGTFRGGTWEGGTWEGGTWEGGTYKGRETLGHSEWPDWMKQADATGFVAMIDGDLMWLDGTWKDGVWKEGTFAGGTFEGGTFESGTFQDGAFQGGTFKGGTFEGGDWNYGRAEWVGGSWQSPEESPSAWEKRKAAEAAREEAEAARRAAQRPSGSSSGGGMSRQEAFDLCCKMETGNVDCQAFGRLDERAFLACKKRVDNGAF